LAKRALRSRPTEEGTGACPGAVCTVQAHQTSFSRVGGLLERARRKGDTHNLQREGTALHARPRVFCPSDPTRDGGSGASRQESWSSNPSPEPLRLRSMRTHSRPSFPNSPCRVFLVLTLDRRGQGACQPDHVAGDVACICASARRRSFGVHRRSVEKTPVRF
jgi:hypothetical protein